MSYFQSLTVNTFSECTSALSKIPIKENYAFMHGEANKSIIWDIPSRIAYMLINLQGFCYMTLYYPLHPEKCFVESTKIWLAQQNFCLNMGQWKFCLN